MVARGQTPVVEGTGQRFGANVISTADREPRKLRTVAGRFRFEGGELGALGTWRGMRASDAKVAAGEVREDRDHAETFEVQQLRAMQQPSWNEARLDDLNTKVEKGFERTDDEFKSVRGEMSRGFERMDEEFKSVRREMSKGFERIDDEFKSVRRDMSKGFERIDDEFKSVRSEMSKGFERIDDEFKSVRREMKTGFDRIQWTLIGAAVAIIVALIGAPHL